MYRAYTRFADALRRRYGQSSTPKHYLSDLHTFRQTLGDQPPEGITPADIDTFIDRQIAAGLRPRTINRRLATLHTFFEFLAGEQPERPWPNPVVYRRHRLRTGSQLPRDLRDSDVARLFALITDRRDRAMFGLMVGAGLRVGEVASLHLDDLEAPAAATQLAKLRVQGKGHKERVVWLSPSLWALLQAWLQVRPPVTTTALFLSHLQQPISVAGIQFRLQQYSRQANLSLSCHRLRHTFARRLVEHGLPVDSLAKLLGHNQLQTTQRYIDGADPTLRADFTAAMARLESSLRSDHPTGTAELPPQPPSPRPRHASPQDLVRLRTHLAPLPPWLADALDTFLTWRWPTWRAQTAYHLGENMIHFVRSIGAWLATHRHVTSWETLRRADLEAWLTARSQAGLRVATVRNELHHLRSLLRFLQRREYALDPELFRVQPPKPSAPPLPRYLPEAEYRRLETQVLQATPAQRYRGYFDRAWFLTLAHTGIRLSELLDLRLDDLNLTAGYATVRGGKPGNDRVVYLTPVLTDALQAYLDRRPSVPDNDHVFVLAHGRSPTGRTIRRRLAQYGQQVGVQVSLHRLRHTLATRLINQEMPIQSLRKLLGHERLQTTQIYARVYDETVYRQFKAAMARLEAMPVEGWPGTERRPMETSVPANTPSINSV